MPASFHAQRQGPAAQKRISLRRGVIALTAVVLTALSAPSLASDGAAPFVLEPAEIDRAVTAFTGAPIGEVGGARSPADARLRLAACATPLTTSWHGRTKAAVKVECQQTRSGAAPWRIFVATRREDQIPARAAPFAPSRPAQPVIKRGDPVTVVVRGRGFTVQQSGEAMENGAIGDWIGVRTARQAEPVRARIERPGLTIIPVG